MSKTEKKDGYKDGDHMKISKEILKKIILESMDDLRENPTISQAVDDLGGTAKATVKNQQVQKFVQQVGERLARVGRSVQIEFLTGLMQALQIDPSTLTQVKTAVQKDQRAAAAVPQGEPQ